MRAGSATAANASGSAAARGVAAAAARRRAPKNADSGAVERQFSLGSPPSRDPAVFGRTPKSRRRAGPAAPAARPPFAFRDFRS